MKPVIKRWGVFQCFVFVVKYCRCYIWNLVIIIAVKYYAGILLRFWDNTSLVLRLSYNIGSLYIPVPALTCPHMTEVNHLQCRWWCAGSFSKENAPLSRVNFHNVCNVPLRKDPGFWKNLKVSSPDDKQAKGFKVLSVFPDFLLWLV